MPDPAFAFQQALYERLTGWAPLVELVGAGIYDDVPEDAAGLYVVIGDDVLMPDDNDCIASFEIYSEVRVQSDGANRVGYRLVKMVAAAVVDAYEAGLTVAGYRVVDLVHERTVPIRDGNGKARRAEIQLRTYLDQLA